MAGSSHPGITLVSGPAASGKSRWAEHLAHKSGKPVIVLATGPDLPEDASWQRRLQRHRQRRPATWRTMEVGGDLSAALLSLRRSDLALVDSMGTWVAAHLELESSLWQVELSSLLEALRRCQAEMVLVSEETGWGVVPVTAAGGRFRDRLGELQQRLTPLCQEAWLVLQGRAIALSPLGVLVPEDPCGGATLASS
ncbi:MAG: bifunctional adenosylcobinamide kinase/adenosylcobinamide-phosphate guanylyltransferase [Cyanobacteriota bacterium]|nr:bifunctional adenosylcobinamide kinase/adenosylcobinamide-phosphate guanylyltransferase [Cyanobacteriota bacterium]